MCGGRSLRDIVLAKGLMTPEALATVLDLESIFLGVVEIRQYKV